METLFLHFSLKFFSILMNILYSGIKWSKLITKIGMYNSIILFSRVYKHNLKQTHSKYFDEMVSDML